MEQLPTEYDAIVVGTGMTGAIVAAALSRVGKAVLHLDHNDFYGEEWASFNLETIETWLNPKPLEKSSESSNVADLMEPTETFVPTVHVQRCSDIEQRWFCPEGSVKTMSKEDNLENTDENEEVTSKDDDKIEVISKEVVDEGWTQAKIKGEHRKFNLDLSPRMLYSRGPLVELLISSNIARYAEFKSVSRVLTWRENRLEVVPCSRADVFATRDVSVVHKRMLVKVLALFLDYPACAEEFLGFESKKFVEYLRHKKLDSQLIHYILYAIAMGGDHTLCLEGVASCQRFLQSLGRYGNTPFICPLYGSGELPQCFCRLCAVFGGVYHLKRPVDGFVVNSDGLVEAILSGGQRLKAKQFVITSSICPPQFVEPDSKLDIRRGIFITDRSLVDSDKEAITLLQFPPKGHGESPVTIMEMGGACHVCPHGLFVVHMTSELRDEKDPLILVQKALFRDEEGPQGSVPTLDDKTESEDGKPAVLWSLTWQMTPGSSTTCDSCPKNIKVFSGPDSGIDFDAAVSQAKEIFTELCPDEEFLPRAPDPEEIVLEDPQPIVEGAENSENEMTSLSKEIEPSAISEYDSISPEELQKDLNQVVDKMQRDTIASE